MPESATQTVALADSTGDGSTAVAPFGFELLAEVGRGGMGVVYRARDLTLDREVAVKLLLEKFATNSATAGRFLEEARITGQLQHPGIPAVYQAGTSSDGRPFLAMKLIKGQTLDDLLKSGATVDALAVFEAIGQAVGYAHAHGVIHRDLKPANVMVGAFGEVQVMDWGLAKLLTRSRDAERSVESDPSVTTPQTEIRLGRDSETPMTQHGSVLGTPAFMAPEQAAGDLNNVDTRSDVFGLGAILCVLLTGSPPYEGRDAMSVRINAVRGKTQAAHARLDACEADPDVVALCKRCLAFEPNDRPKTADEVAVAVAGLRRAADDRVRQAELTGARAIVEAVGQRKRRKSLQWAAVVVIWVLVGGATAALWQAKRAMRAEFEAVSKQFEAEQAREAEAEQRKLAEAAGVTSASQRIKAESAALAEADQRKKADAAKAHAEAMEAEANTVVLFFADKVLAAARPKGQNGGLGVNVTVRAAIDAALTSLDRDFASQPFVEARLRLTLGNTLRYLGDGPGAVRQDERVRAIYLAQRGPDHLDTLRSARNLAASYSHVGRYPEALKLREEALAICRRVFPPDDLETMSCMGSLANGYSAANRQVEALELREETLAICKRVLPKDHEDTMLGMNNLANSYGLVGRPKEALALNEEVWAIRKRVLPANHKDIAMSMDSVAGNYSLLGRYAESVKLYEDVLAIRKRDLPPDHPDTIGSMVKLSLNYIAVGRTLDAFRLTQEVLAARKRGGKPE